MYTVAVRRDFIARHLLIGVDPGPESESHAHHYSVEARLHGDKLNQHGYLIDICEVETRLEEIIRHFRDANLNDLPEFSDLNPSLEHFARIFFRSLLAVIISDNLTALSLRIWENDAAWAEYREDF